MQVVTKLKKTAAIKLSHNIEGQSDSTSCSSRSSLANSSRFRTLSAFSLTRLIVLLLATQSYSSSDSSSCLFRRSLPVLILVCSTLLLLASLSFLPTRSLDSVNHLLIIFSTLCCVFLFSDPIRQIQHNNFVLSILIIINIPAIRSKPRGDLLG